MFDELLLTVLLTSVPLILAATGELVVERSGVLNLGVEGMMLMGAVAAFGAASLSGNPYIGIVGGGLAGMAVAGVGMVGGGPGVMGDGTRMGGGSVMMGGGMMGGGGVMGTGVNRGNSESTVESSASPSGSSNVDDQYVGGSSGSGTKNWDVFSKAITFALSPDKSITETRSSTTRKGKKRARGKRH